MELLSVVVNSVFGDSWLGVVVGLALLFLIVAGIKAMNS